MKKYNHYSIHRTNESHLKTMGNGISIEGNVITVYIEEGYERKIVGIYNLDNIQGIRQVTGWEEGKKK